MDRGHERTEQVISKIEGRLRAEYEQAAKEVQETLDDYMERFALKDKKWQEWVKDGKRTHEQYDAWRKQQLMQGDRWKAIKQQLAHDMVNTTSIARSIVQSYMPEIYELNANYALYQVEVGNGYTLPSSLTLYNREAVARLVKDEPDLMPMGKNILGDIARGKAERWERQKVQSIMLQGILQGKSNVRIAQDIAENLANGDFKASMRYARTMSTNAQNGGRYGAYRRLEDNGVPLTLQWEATLDMRTRHEHRMMHGQRRNVNQPFVVDGVEILYPAWLGMGDYKVPPDLVWNCRCTILAWVKGFEHDALRQSERMEGLSYEEWLKAKEKTLPITHQRDVGEAMRMRYIREYGGDGSGLKKSFSDKVHGIIDKAKQDGKERTTETIRAVGKEFAREVNEGYLKPLNESLKKAHIFESEKNKLSYDTEIEAIYLLGDFSVRTDGKWEKLENNAVRYTGDFKLENQKDRLYPKNIEQQGYPFFAGEITVETEIDIKGRNPVLSLDMKGINAIRVKIGDIEKVMLADSRLPLSGFGVNGKTKAEITIINNLRNMLGPHHLKEGECYSVVPGCFFKEACIWANNPENKWDNNYCFVQMSV